MCLVFWGGGGGGGVQKDLGGDSQAALGFQEEENLLPCWSLPKDERRGMVDVGLSHCHVTLWFWAACLPAPACHLPAALPALSPAGMFCGILLRLKACKLHGLKPAV